MPTSHHCKREWKWKQAMKASFTLDTALECPHCGEEQYLTRKSRKKQSMLVFIIPLMILIPSIADISIALMFVIYVIVALVLFAVMPFFMELTDQEEQLW